MKTLALIPLLCLFQQPQDKVSFEEKTLSTIPENVTASDIVFSPDGRHVAYRALVGGRYAVYVDKQKGPDFTNVSEGISFSSDGKVAFRASMGDQWAVYVGGQTVGAPGKMVGKPIWSPDGKKVAFEHTRGQGGRSDSTAWTVYTAGQKGPDFANCGSPTWSADGSITAYNVRIGKAGTAQRAFYTTHAMCVAGKVGPESEECSPAFFAPKGNRLAYKSRDKATWTMIVDGKPMGSYTDLGNPVWSPDGKSLAYRVGEKNKFAVVVDGKKGDDFDQVSEPAWSPDSKTLAYAVTKGGEDADTAFIMLGGKPLELFKGAQIGAPVFSPDGTKVAYGLRLPKEKWKLIAGDKKGAADYDLIERIVWSPDSKHVAFHAMWKYKWMTCIDDGKNEMFDQMAMFPAVWNSTSTKLAYAAQKEGKWYMVVGYKRLEPWDEILTPAHFSNDGAKCAFGGRKGPDLVWRVVSTAD